VYLSHIDDMLFGLVLLSEVDIAHTTADEVLNIENQVLNDDREITVLRQAAPQC